MQVHIHPDAKSMGAAAAKAGSEAMRQAISERGGATIIVATGASQFDMLACLVKEPGIDWPCVTVFHLDEYIGIDESHPASFRKYLRERFVKHVPVKNFYAIAPGSDPAGECDRLNTLIQQHHIDVAFVGIGENGHLAFNDPPADFKTESPYIVADLDEACRRQQLGEGWFNSLNDVPKQAISMSVRQILKSQLIICTVPDQRKADAVARSVQGEVTPEVPASILQQHPATHLFVDHAAASMLDSQSKTA